MGLEHCELKVFKSQTPKQVRKDPDRMFALKVLSAVGIGAETQDGPTLYFHAKACLAAAMKTYGEHRTIVGREGTFGIDKEHYAQYTTIESEVRIGQTCALASCRKSF